MLEHSVLIYTRNHGGFIDECIASVLAQSVPPAEIIVYDDGSTDGTVEAVRRYGDRVRLICGEGLCQRPFLAEAHAIQTAFAYSRGRIVFLLDGDDRFKTEKIARYLAAFDAHPDAAVVQAPLERVDQSGHALGLTFEPRCHVTNHLREIYRRHDVNFFYPTSALAFSRYYLERIFPLDLDDGLPLWTDARLCIPAAYFGRIVTLLDPLTDWRYYASADTARNSSGGHQLRQIFVRAEVFNTFCRRNKLRTITPWRNRRMYLHLLRYMMPARLFDYLVRHARPALDWFG
jgi:glycosyltransferase involved in cell wall biosynthesis